MTFRKKRRSARELPGSKTNDVQQADGGNSKKRSGREAPAGVHPTRPGERFLTRVMVS